MVELSLVCACGEHGTVKVERDAADGLIRAFFELHDPAANTHCAPRATKLTAVTPPLADAYAWVDAQLAKVDAAIARRKAT